MTASPNDSGGLSSIENVAAALPDSVQAESLAVATVIAGGLGILWAMNKGFKGIGEFELTGSAAGAVQWAAYAAVVGGTYRVLQVNFPDNKLVQALAFVY